MMATLICQKETYHASFKFWFIKREKGLYAEVASSYGKFKSIHEIVKKGKEICASFVGIPTKDKSYEIVRSYNFYHSKSL